MATAAVPVSWKAQSPVSSWAPATGSGHTITISGASKNGPVSSPIGGSVVSTYEALKAQKFSKGEQVQVYSKSRQEWIAGTVAEAFHSDCVFNGYTMRPGALLVSYSDTSKYVLPEDVDSVVRKVAQPMATAMTRGRSPIVQHINAVAGQPRTAPVAGVPAQMVQAQAAQVLSASSSLAPAPVAVGGPPVATQQPNVIVQPVTANSVAAAAPPIGSPMASLGPQQLATSSTGPQIAGTVVTKTTVQKMFIPADPSQPPVPVGNAAAQVATAPGIAVGSAAANAAPQANLLAPVMTRPDPMESATVPAISGPMARTLNVRPTDQVCGEYSAIAAPMAAPLEYGEGPRFIPIPQDDGTGRGYAYVPNQNLYQLDNQPFNEVADELPEGYYQYEDQDGMYQIDDGYGVYQGDMEMQRYRESFYEEDQQYAADVQAMLDQQYVESYYVDPSNDMQEPVQYVQNGYGNYEVDADVAAGIPRPAEEKREEAPAEDQFTRLLNSLEARVDLMAQMQHTRAEIQKHTRNLQGGNNNMQGRGLSPVRDSQLALPGVEPRQPPLLDLEPERPFSNMVGDFGFSGSTTGRFGTDDVEATALISNPAAHLARENAILRDEFEDQKGAIEKLCGEVQGMRQQLHSIATQPLQRSRSPLRQRWVDETALLPPGTRVEARWMKDDNPMGFSGPWLPGYLARSNQDGTFHVEYDNGDACTTVPADCVRLLGEALEQFREGDEEDALQSMQGDDEVKTLQIQLNEERRRHETSTQQWWRERRRLLDELQTLKGGGRRALGNLPAVGEDAEGAMTTGNLVGYSSALCTSPVLPANGGRPGAIAPLCQNPCGLNIELSQDGYMAKRIRGCRQSVVIGSGPLELQDLGHYFEVIVRETVNGWVGGLGLGVTRVTPTELKRMPDKAWRIPNTFIVGYWGCLFLDGREKRTRWKADTLKVGSRVGLLVTGDGRGDLIVFVDGEPVVRADDVLPTSGIPEPLYPVIDVFAATLAVELQAAACAPAKPWGKDPSPPGSPASVARSVSSSTVASVGKMSSMGTSLAPTDS